MSAPAQVVEAPTLPTTAPRKAVPYRIAADAARGATGENSYVTRGTHGKTGVPALVHVDGSTQTALPLGVIGAAILFGVVTDAEVDDLRSKRAK